MPCPERLPLSRPALIRILTAIQNSAFYAHQDILTFTGFMDDAEVGQHVWSRFSVLPDADKRRVFETARDMFATARLAEAA